jgi:phototropin
VDRYNTLLDELTKTVSEIHRKFTAPDAPKQLNLSHSMMKQMNADIKMTSLTTLPAMELMFADSQEEIESLLSTDIYPRFVKHQMTTSAVKALSGDRGRFAGLGDCFCLTNPA